MGDVVGQAWWEADLKDEKLKAKLRELDALMRQQGAESEQHLNRGWSAALDNAGRSLQTMGRRVTSTGDAMTRNLTLPIVGAGLAIGKMGLDFDTTLRRTVGLAGVAAGSIDGIRKEILAMGAEVGKGPQELAEAFYFVASAGFEADEAMVVLRTSAMAAAAGLGETQTIAQVLGGVINAYGKENITAARAADILTEAVAQGTAEASGLASVIGNVVPGAAALGVSFDQVTAAMAGMTLSAVGVEEAATSLINIFSSLQKPTVQAEEALEGLGLSSAGLRRQLREEGLLSTLRTLEERFEGNETASAAVFGNIRALRGVTALLGLDTEQLNDVFAEVYDSTGRLAEGYEATEGPQRELARSMAEIQATAIELGTDVLPVVVDILKELAGGARQLAAWWGSLDDDTKRFVVQMLAMIAVAGPLLSIVGKMASGIGGLIRLVAFMGGPKSLAFFRSFAAGFYLALGPIGLVAAAVGALVVGFQTDFLGMRTRLERDINDMALNFGSMGDSVHALADRMGIDFNDAKNQVNDAMVKLGLSFEAAVRYVERGGEQMSAALIKSGEDWEAYQHQISGGTADAVDAAALEAAGLPPEVAAALAAGGEAVGDGAEAMLADVEQEAAEARAAAIDEMAAMINGLSSMFESDESVHEAWQSLIDRMDDPYTEAERKTEIFGTNTILGIRGALASGDPALIGDTKDMVNRLLGEFALMEPGALESGKAVPPAVRSGMDSEMSALIAYLEEQHGVIIEKLTLDEARELGLESIWQYAQGMRANRIEAERVAGRIAMDALAELHISGFSGGASLIRSWVNGMSTQWWSNDIYRVEGMAGAAAQIFGMSLPTAGPLKGGVASGGISIGESWVGGIVASIEAGRRSIETAVGGVGTLLTINAGASAPLDFAGAAASTGVLSPGAMAAVTGSAGNGGGSTFITERHVHVHPVGPVPVETDDDLRRVIDRTEWIGDQGAWADG